MKRKKKLKKKCAHLWVYKWEETFKRCKKCKTARWWWECENKWRMTMPSVYLIVGHTLNSDTAPKGADDNIYMAKDDALAYGDEEILPDEGALLSARHYYQALDRFNGALAQ